MRIGVVGAGVWGKNLVRVFSKLGVLCAVADPVDANRQNAESIQKDLRLFSNHAELITSGLDAVAIATPAATHHGIAKQAIEAGLDVFVEKPLTLDPAEAEELCQLAEDHGRILMVGHLLLYQPAVAWIKDYLQAGKLGAIRTMHQRRSKLGRARSVENVLWSFGVHDVAVLLSLANSAITEINVSGHSALSAGVEDDVYLHLTFESGVKAHLHNSWLWPRIERELIVIGDQGMLEYDEVGQRVLLHRKSINDRLENVDQGSEVVFEGASDPLTLELSHFIDCCRHRQVPRSDGRSAVQVVNTLDQAERQFRY